MTKQFKIFLYLLLVAFLFSCGSIADERGANGSFSSLKNDKEIYLTQSENNQKAEENSTKLASDKKYSFAEIDKKYKSLKLKYSKKRADFSSDEVFANFRNVKIGNIKAGILYRGASPIDNSMGRAKYVDKLISEAGIKFDIDLTDSDKKIKRHFSKKDFASEYFKKLYENGQTICLNMNTNYREQQYHDKIVKAMIAMSKNEGPYYVHCVEGKNRTGFLLAVIEGLAGASYEEIVKDHMITFANYYGITEENDKEKYDVIKARYIDSMLRYIADSDPWTGNGTIELSDLDWVNVMGRYLLKNGMSEDDLHAWYEKMTEENYNDP